MKHFLLGMLLLVRFLTFGQEIPSPGSSCGLTLSGKVIDQHHGGDLPAASIVLEGKNLATQTDAAGNYHFHDLCPGVYTVVASYVGFVTIRQEVRLNTSAIRNFKLHHLTNELGTVQVSGQRVGPTPTQASGQLSGRALAQTRGESLGKALEQLSGVTTLNTGPTISKPIIHGLHSNRVLLLNNGVRHEGQQWGTEHAPEIDANVAAKLTVVKGAAGVRYGSDAIGGVVLVEPAPLRDSAGTDAVLNLVGMSNNRMGHVGGTVNHNFARRPALSMRLQGSVKRGGNTRTPDYYLKNTAFSEYNFSVGLGYKKDNYGLELYYSQFNTQLGILSAAHIGNLTDLLAAIESPVPLETDNFTYKIGRPSQLVNHDLIKLSGFFRTGDLGRITWVSSFQDNYRGEYDLHAPLGNDLASRKSPEIGLRLNTLYNELVWEHKPLKNLSGSVGVTGMAQRNRYFGREFIPNYHNYTAGLFWIERWRKNKWELEAGTRYDYRFLDKVFFRSRRGEQPSFRYHNFSGTVGAIYELDHHVNFRLNAGTAFRSPNVNELFSNGLHHGTASIEIGDPTIKPENAYNVVVTATYQSEKKLNGEISFHYNYIRNYIFLNPVFPPTLTVRGAFPTFQFTQTDARFKGIDVNFSYGLTDGFSVLGKASLLWAYNVEIEDYLILTPANRVDAHLRYESEKQNGTFIQVGAQLVGQQFRVPAVAAFRANPEDNGPVMFTPVKGDYKAPPAGYFLLQASMGTTLNLGKQPVEISLSGNNLLNNSYRDYLNRFRYFADEMGRNIVLRLQIPLNFNPN